MLQLAPRLAQLGVQRLAGFRIPADLLCQTNDTPVQPQCTALASSNLTYDAAQLQRATLIWISIVSMNQRFRPQPYTCATEHAYPAPGRANMRPVVLHDPYLPFFSSPCTRCRAAPSSPSGCQEPRLSLLCSLLRMKATSCPCHCSVGSRPESEDPFDECAWCTDKTKALLHKAKIAV